MFYILSLAMGVLISVMVAFNGGLTGAYGVYTATVIIHVVGLCLISFFVKRKELFVKNIAWYLYLGGAIGVLTTVFNNFSFGRISVSAILALGLLGQSVAGIIIDHFGLFGMKKYKFNAIKLAGFVWIFIGLVTMISDFHIIAVFVSFFAGVNIALSRILNARLSEFTSVRVSTFFNYFIGLIVSLIVFVFIGRGEVRFENFSLSSNWWIYLGGVLGVMVVFLGNIVAVKISAYYLALFIFVGQVVTGILIDMFLMETFSFSILIGGLFVATGLVFNLGIDERIRKKETNK